MALFAGLRKQHFNSKHPKLAVKFFFRACRNKQKQILCVCFNLKLASRERRKKKQYFHCSAFCAPLICGCQLTRCIFVEFFFIILFLFVSSSVHFSAYKVISLQMTSLEIFSFNFFTEKINVSIFQTIDIDEVLFLD